MTDTAVRAAKRQTVTVGSSDRTPGKHELLNAYLGMQMGACSTFGRGHRVFLHDLTAGDGEAQGGKEWIRGCSPGLMAYHGAWVAEQGFDVEVLLTERQTDTFDLLSRALRAELPKRGWDVAAWEADRLEARRGRARLVAAHQGYPLTDVCCPPNGIGFLFNDPNTIADWGLPRGFIGPGCGRYTLSLSTLGCNCGGLKRCPIHERERWFEHVAYVVTSMQRWHDALLLRLDGDAAQWAYLTVAPEVWRGRVYAAARKAFAGVGWEIDAVWYRQDRARFDAMCDLLFRTRKEREQ